MKWISVIILLVALSMVNASPFHIYKRDNLLHKRAVAFVPCDPPSTIKLAGSIDPDPVPGTPAKSKAVFTTTEEVPKLFLTTIVLSDGADPGTAKVTTADLCTAGLECPVPKGKEVTVTSTTDIPADIKAPYTVQYNFNDGAKVVSCGVAKVAEAAAPKGDAPKGDEPKADEPKADEPKADEPKGGKEPEEPKGGDPPEPEEEPKGGDPPPEEPKGGPPPEEEPKEPPKRR